MCRQNQKKSKKSRHKELRERALDLYSSNEDLINLPKHLRLYGVQLRQTSEYGGPSLLAAESDEGQVEYKLRLSSSNASRFQQLVTQLKFRLSEGSGQCYYYIGVEDNGHPKGLPETELHSSLETLHKMAIEVAATATILRTPPGVDGGKCAVVRVTYGSERHVAHQDLRIAVTGGVDSGKSTLVAVLSHGARGEPSLDNGRGSARMSVFRHKHEIETGRTSSISHTLLAYDEKGDSVFVIVFFLRACF